jgi:predicted nucleic acid-binding Zn ribbon protein
LENIYQYVEYQYACNSCKINIDVLNPAPHRHRTGQVGGNTNGQLFSPSNATAMKPLIRGKRRKQDLHFLNEDGMIACNPRDREAAHRAEVEGIATENPKAVTCKKCYAVVRKTDRQAKRG